VACRSTFFHAPLRSLALFLAVERHPCVLVLLPFFISSFQLFSPPSTHNTTFTKNKNNWANPHSRLLLVCRCCIPPSSFACCFVLVHTHTHTNTFTCSFSVAFYDKFDFTRPYPFFFSHLTRPFFCVLVCLRALPVLYII
jgi:hypothetical protein